MAAAKASPFSNSVLNGEHHSTTSISTFISPPSLWSHRHPYFTTKFLSLSPSSSSTDVSASSSIPIKHLTLLTRGISLASKAATKFFLLLPTRETAINREDSISLLHERIHCEHGKRDFPPTIPISTFNKSRSNNRGDCKSSRAKATFPKSKGEVFSYKIDPYTLRFQ